MPITINAIDIKTDIEMIIGGFGADLTSPEYQARIADLSNSYAALVQMKIEGAAEDMINDATNTMKARVTVLVNAPGLFAANRQSEVMGILNDVLGFGINLAFNAFRVAIADA